MKINWNYIKTTLLLVLIAFLFGFSNYKNKQQKVTSTDVQFEKGDNMFLTYEMVNKLLIQNEMPVQNQAKTLINLNDLEGKIVDHPMVENATAFLTVDGHLKTRVKQRTPIGRIFSRNESYYIDIKGLNMPLSDRYSSRVPAVKGNFSDGNLDDLHQLLMLIRSDDFLQKQIIEVRKSEENNFKLMTRIGNCEIDLGKFENLKTKFKNLKAFYSLVLENKTVEDYSKINLRYNNQVVCTKKIK